MIVGMLAVAVSAALHRSPLRWSKLVALGVVLLPGHTPLHAAVRSMARRAWDSRVGNLVGNLSATEQFFAGFPAADAPICEASLHAVTGAASGHCDARQHAHSLLEQADGTAASMVLDTAPALLSGFVVATCPLPTWVRAPPRYYAVSAMPRREAAACCPLVPAGA
jgi:hypothetical protein